MARLGSNLSRIARALEQLAMRLSSVGAGIAGHGSLMVMLGCLFLAAGPTSTPGDFKCNSTLMEAPFGPNDQALSTGVLVKVEAGRTCTCNAIELPTASSCRSSKVHFNMFLP